MRVQWMGVHSSDPRTVTATCSRLNGLGATYASDPPGERCVDLGMLVRSPSLRRLAEPLQLTPVVVDALPANLGKPDRRTRQPADELLRDDDQLRLGEPGQVGAEVPMGESGQSLQIHE